MKTIQLIIALFLVSASLVASPINSSYVLPSALSDWTCQTQTYEKQGHRVATYAIFSPDRTHVVTLAFVDGYADKDIGKAHFDTLATSFAQAGLKEVKEQKEIEMYGMKGAQIIAQGVVQQKEIKGKGMILKNGESELTIMLFAVGAELDDASFAIALSGLGVAPK